MKVCPTCNRAYADDSIVYCLNDGALLSESAGEQETVVSPRNQLKPQKAGNPHLIYAVAGLLGLLIAVAGFVYVFTSNRGSTEPVTSSTVNKTSATTPVNKSLPTPSGPTQGTLQVDATSRQGTSFTIPCSNGSVGFRASGQWTFWDSIGMHSADGHSRYRVAEPNYPMPSKPPGSLILKKQNGSYEYVGLQNNLAASPNERVALLINEDFGGSSGDGMKDNRGSLTISWSCDGYSATAPAPGRNNVPTMRELQDTLEKEAKRIVDEANR